MKVTLEQVVKEFDSKIKTTIRNYGFLFEDPEDVRQSVYLAMHRRKYLDKYNPKYKLSTYVYTFVRNYCDNVKRDSFRKKRIGRYQASSLDSGHFVLVSSEKTLKNLEESTLFDQLSKDILGQNIKLADNRVIYLQDVIKQLLLGYNINQVAKILKTSRNSIEKRLKGLSNNLRLKEYNAVQ